MHCAAFEERILDYFDHRLSAADRHLVESHVAICAACRRFWNEQQTLDARLAAGLGRPTLSPDFKQRVLRQVDAAAAPETLAAREQKRRLLEMEFEARRAALRKYFLTVPNLLDALAYATVAMVAGLVLYSIAGGLPFVPPKTPAAVFQDPLILVSLAGGVIGLVWGLEIGLRSEVARWTSWF